MKTPVKFRHCDVSEEIKSLALGKACDFYCIPNECLRHLPRRPLIHLTYFFNHYFRLCHFPVPWKEAKVVTLPMPSKDPTFPQNLLLISFLSTVGKIFEKLILRTIEILIEERNMLNASQFGFRAHHSTTLQCVKLTDHVTLNFNTQGTQVEMKTTQRKFKTQLAEF
jgi:hypothetical protein